MTNETLIRCRNLTKVFQSSAEDLNVLKQLNLDVPAGARVAIKGASGSGKSTLLSILGGLDRPSGGSVHVGEWDVGGLPDSRLAEYRASAIGFVFQFHYLLKDFSAIENVALPAYMLTGNRTESWKMAQDLLVAFELESRMEHYPSQLSGGERQKTAIARAMINKPLVILADEPTGNLDTASALSVRRLLFELSPRFGTTLVLVTHDRELAEAADCRFELQDGALGPG